MASDGIERREFLKKIPLFGAGLALGLSALADSGETPKARKIAGGNIEPQGACNLGTCNTGGCNLGGCVDGTCVPGTCHSGTLT